MRGGYYRPAYVHALAGRARRAGQRHRLAAPDRRPVDRRRDRVRGDDGQGRRSTRPASKARRRCRTTIPNLAVELHSPKVGVPVLWWRSVGSTHTAYSTETFIDELAPRRARTRSRSAGPCSQSIPRISPRWTSRRRRPAGARRSHRARPARSAAAAWRCTSPSAASSRRSPRSTVDRARPFSVDRVVCAVHCGIAVNPDNVRAQMEGGIGFGLSAALHGAITLKDGAVEQSNFHDYPVLRINEMPAIEVHIVPSADKPSGVGEPGVPPVAPAVANALAAATGQRLRKLPFALGLRPARSPPGAGPMHTPAGFVSGHALPAVLPATTHAFVFSGDRLLVAGGEGATPAAPVAARVPTLGTLAATRIDGPRHYLGALAGVPCVALRVPDDTPPPSGWRFAGLRSLFFALPDAELALAGERLPGRRVGSNASLLRRLRHADARQAGRARQGMPGLRPRRLPARFAGDDGARHARPRRAARPRASLPARRCTARSPDSSNPGETIEDCIRREVREEVGVEIDEHRVLRQPVVGVPAFADDRVHGGVRRRGDHPRGRRDRRRPLVRARRAAEAAARRVDRAPADRRHRLPAGALTPGGVHPGGAC